MPKFAASSDCTSGTCMYQFVRGSDWLLFVGTAAIASRCDAWLPCAGDVACMDLGQVPAGRQRSRFLAVGSHDQTVRRLGDERFGACQTVLLWVPTRSASQQAVLPTRALRMLGSMSNSIT